jgi:hypothetical protein
MSIAKKTVSREYLETKLKDFQEQQIKIENLIEQYNEMWQRLAGAIEATSNMLEEFIEIKESKKDE